MERKKEYFLHEQFINDEITEEEYTRKMTTEQYEWEKQCKCTSYSTLNGWGEVVKLLDNKFSVSISPVCDNCGKPWKVVERIHQPKQPEQLSQ